MRISLGVFLVVSLALAALVIWLGPITAGYVLFGLLIAVLLIGGFF